jgi:hypothetical protein
MDACGSRQSTPHIESKSLSKLEEASARDLAANARHHRSARVHFLNAHRVERAEGDWLLLDVPLGFNLTPDTWEEEESEEVFALQSQVHPVWRGFHRPPLIDADGSLREPSVGERASEQKLARLAETAQTISDQIGSEPAAVIVYLLCGE